MIRVRYLTSGVSEDAGADRSEISDILFHKKREMLKKDGREE